MKTHNPDVIVTSHYPSLAARRNQQQRQQRTQHQPVDLRKDRGAWLSMLPKGIGHRSYAWLFEEPQNPGVSRAPVVMKQAPVPAKRVKPDRSRLSREDLSEVFRLDRKELTQSYLASMARSRELEKKLSEKKKELVEIGMIKAGEPVPMGFKRHGVFLSFEVESRLRKARHVVAEEGCVVVLSEEAQNDPTSPWRQQSDMGAWVAGILKEVIEQVKAAPLRSIGVWTKRPELEEDYDEMQKVGRRYVPAPQRKFRPARAPRVSASLSRTGPVYVPRAAVVARPVPVVPVDLLAHAGVSRRVW